MATYAIVLLTLVLSVLPVWATDYYFSNAGSDSNSGTSSGSPFATLAKFATLTINAGDNFYFRCGDTFTDTSGNGADWTSRSGTSGSHITVTSYGTCTGSNRPIWTKSGGSGYGLILKSSDYIDVANLDIRGYQFGIELRGARNHTYTDIVIRDTGNGCVALKQDTNNSNRSTRDITITRAELDTCGDGTEQGEGFYIGDNDNSAGNGNITITNAYVHDTFFECVEVKPGTDPSISISQSTFEHCHRTNAGSSFTPSGNSGTGIVAASAGGGDSQVVFSRNWIKDVVGTENDVTGLGARWNGQSIDARYNIIANNAGEGIRSLGATGFTQSWFNNTIYGNGRECINDSNASSTFTDNTCWANASGNDASNPNFTNAASNNFNFAATSPLYHTGSGGVSKGALQPFPWVSGTVDASGTTATLTGQVFNTFQPISAATASAFTITCSTAGAQVATAAVPNGNASVRVTVTTTIGQGETCTATVTAGAAQDSANIGGTLAPGGPRNSTSLAVTGMSLTNNSAGGETAPNLFTPSTLLTDCTTCTIGNCSHLIDGLLTDPPGGTGTVTAESATSFACEYDLGSSTGLALYRAYCDNGGSRFTTNVTLEAKVNAGDSYTTLVNQGICNARDWFEFTLGGVSYRYIKATFFCIGCTGTQAMEHFLGESPETLPPPGLRITRRRGSSVRSGFMR